MNKLSPHRWTEILSKVGVDPLVALSWADTFSDFFVGDVFSSGDGELDDFLSQIIHESSYLKKLEESLSYRATRMMEVWPKRFPTLESAKPFEFKPQLLANKVYNGRLGNAVDSNDGWNYRGSGLIMVTGKANFEFIEKELGLPVVENPELLRTPGPTALVVAAQWWEGKVPDHVMGDAVKVRKAVNGGSIGLDDTRRLATKLKELLNG